jgi:alpha-beta hydrolase superfamily lysophospholipase
MIDPYTNMNQSYKSKVGVMIFQLWPIVLSIFISGCSGLLYHPTHIVHYEPKQLKLELDVEIEVEPNVKVHGWYLKSQTKKPKGVIVFFHGNAENITSHYVSLSWILKEGYDYFIWDYRGYGKSQGKPSPQNTVHDGIIVIKHIYNQNPKLPLFVFAQSLGGAIAMRSVIDLNGEVPIRGLAVDSTFQSYQGVAREVLSRGWITWLFQPLAYITLSDKFAPAGKIDRISPIPFMVIHGTEDTVVKYKFGEEVFKDAQEPKEFLKIEGGHHIDAFWNKNSEEHRKKFLSFLNKNLT